MFCSQRWEAHVPFLNPLKFGDFVIRCRSCVFQNFSMIFQNYLFFARRRLLQIHYQNSRISFAIVMFTFRLRQIFQRTVPESQLIEPVERLRCKQECHPVATHPSGCNQVAHNCRADSRLAIIRRYRNRCDFRRIIFKRMKCSATVNRIVYCINDIIRQFFL